MFSANWLAESKAAYDRLKAAAEASIRSKKKKHRAKSTRAEGLFKQVFKTIQLLTANPRHPGLQTHEYDSIANPFDKKEKVFEACVQQHTPGAYRLFWCYGPEKRQYHDHRHHTAPVAFAPGHAFH